jgi:hypothetical protein
MKRILDFLAPNWRRDGLLPTFGDSWTLSLSTLAAIGLILYLL